VDQDSGRKAGRSVPRRENGSGPRHRLDARPPSGAANPLPRRSAQGHIEPQLRTPGGAGTGTPFTPFGPDHDAPPLGAGAAAAVTPGAKPRVEPGVKPIAEPGAGSGAKPGAEPGAKPGAVADASAAADFRDGTTRGRNRTDPPAD
jgi:hypothetical protein